MARIPNRFYDGLTEEEYEWPLNHNEEEEQGVTKALTATATTSGNAYVYQQGAGEPLLLRYSGTILRESQHQEFVKWDRRCRIGDEAGDGAGIPRTIQFFDFHGDHYEVVIAYKAKRERVMRNPRGGTENPLHIYRYTLEMTVIRVLAGSWA